MRWIDFVLCLFLGVFGVHKFREKKIGIGILYLFTCGLFGVGWLYDCARYLIAALKAAEQSSIEPISSATCDEPMFQDSVERPPALLHNLKKYWRWILTGVLALFAFAGFPSVSALLALVAIALVIPIPQWQTLIEKKIKGKSKSIAVIGMAVLAFFSFPANPGNDTADHQKELTPIVTEAPESIHMHNFVDATCIAPKTCSDCGETEGTALGHTWEAASCLTPKTCSVCQEKEGELGDHRWTDATCLTPKTCAVCQKTDGEVGEHVWEAATCLVPKTCLVCQATEGELADHIWEEASCLAPKTCSVCKETKGDVAKHTWKAATCLAPKTCTVCKVTKGDVAKHSWEKATCMAPKTCSVCGEQDGDATDCKYKNGICVYCEDEEPTVWIPRSGRRYHARSSCSGMNDPTEVPISKAISQGFTPCGRCY